MWRDLTEGGEAYHDALIAQEILYPESVPYLPFSPSIAMMEEHSSDLLYHHELESMDLTLL